MSNEDTGNAKQPDPVADEPLENKAKQSETPDKGNVADSSVEQLRKDLEKERMEKNMLRNKLDTAQQEKAKQEQAKLEEKEEFRTLYEQEKARAEALAAEKEEAEKSRALTEATGELLADFSDEVKATVEETGLSLGDLSEEAREEFKTKVGAIAKRVDTTTIAANNPNPNPPKAGRAELIDNYRLNRKDPKAWNDLAMSIPSVKEMVEKSQQ